MSELRIQNGLFYEKKVVILLEKKPADFRSFQSITNIPYIPKDAHEFLTAWGTTGEDSTREFLRIANELERGDIIEAFKNVYRI